jgi:hypothetical protein
MNINSRAYRRLHPRGKATRRDAMERGQERRKREEAEGKHQIQPLHPPLATNHNRHRIRKMHREFERNQGYAN